MNIRAKPIRNSPIDFLRLALAKSNGTAQAISGSINAEVSTLNPNSEMIRAVNVVPTLAPNMTAIDCPSVMRPALTKLTTITVEADELG